MDIMEAFYKGIMSERRRIYVKLAQLRVLSMVELLELKDEIDSQDILNEGGVDEVVEF